MKKLMEHKTTLMKEKNPDNKAVINVINEILTGFKNEAVKLKTTVENLKETDKQAVIKSVKKKLEQEIDALEKAGRDVAYQIKQKDFVETLLPKMKSFDEMVEDVEEIVSNGADNMGTVMKSLKEKGEYDMKQVSQYVKELFAKK